MMCITYKEISYFYKPHCLSRLADVYNNLRVSIFFIDLDTEEKNSNFIKKSQKFTKNWKMYGKFPENSGKLIVVVCHISTIFWQ